MVKLEKFFSSFFNKFQVEVERGQLLVALLSLHIIMRISIENQIFSKYKFTSSVARLRINASTTGDSGENV